CAIGPSGRWNDWSFDIW
nr:immunoglobulin heavy chain junction region [Macaca mulatta]MOX58751.1 immunoglobulin heavy chain junction region [Macaca mulatta]MOX58828.1 immunoglobulin heavy chain junction region [Macaca mulatta]MOX59071.1 immunoglobulin heavy chain junction region [Macaca mulatta]MOX59198.1 immunoglobulin heavy chain junction region [Macaca mulatta]